MKNIRFSIILLILVSHTFLKNGMSIFNKKYCKTEEIVMIDEEKNAIKQIIEKAYIQGIHGNQDVTQIKKGFHQYFNMLVMKNNTVELVNMDEWLQRIEKMKDENPDLWNAKTTYHFRLIDVTGYSGVAVLDLYKGDIHFSTDYILLYKFDKDWMIVSKIFSIPEN